MAVIQCFLRSQGEDDLAEGNAHQYVPSTGNQRIEAWWSYLRRGRYTWWINFFKDMVSRGTLLLGSKVHEECAWFCFAEVIQHELDFVRIYWNTHYIRESRHDTIPGRPDKLLFLPELCTAVNHLQPVDDVKVEELQNRYSIPVDSTKK